MDDRLYQFLKYTAIVFALAWAAWAFYDNTFRHTAPGEHAYQAGNRAFQDGNYERALAQYRKSLEQKPGTDYALHGKAQTLIQLERYDDALEVYQRLTEVHGDAGATYANRGILLDRIGEHERALADYRRALELDPELADGPHWMTRFLRNQPEAPPTIADRAAYIEAQLDLPESERVLRQPEADRTQRPYRR